METYLRAYIFATKFPSCVKLALPNELLLVEPLVLIVLFEFAIIIPKNTYFYYITNSSNVLRSIFDIIL